jgi:hypothetical protein
VFQRKQKQLNQKFYPPDKPVVYPKWTFAKVEDKYWLILEKTRMRFISERAFWSWGKPYVMASEKSLSKYDIWKNVGFSPGTLVSTMNGQTWFITGSKPLEAERRLILTPDFYFVLGFDEKNCFKISEQELLFHQEGEQINNV